MARKVKNPARHRKFANILRTEKKYKIKMGSIPEYFATQNTSYDKTLYFEEFVSDVKCARMHMYKKRRE